MSWVTVISERSSSIMLYRCNTQTLTVAVYTEVIRDCFGNAAAYSTVLTITGVLSMLLFSSLPEGGISACDARFMTFIIDGSKEHPSSFR